MQYALAIMYRYHALISYAYYIMQCAWNRAIVRREGFGGGAEGGAGEAPAAAAAQVGAN